MHTKSGYNETLICPFRQEIFGDLLHTRAHCVRRLVGG